MWWQSIGLMRKRLKQCYTCPTVRGWEKNRGENSSRLLPLLRCLILWAKFELAGEDGVQLQAFHLSLFHPLDLLSSQFSLHIDNTQQAQSPLLRMSTHRFLGSAQKSNG